MECSNDEIEVHGEAKDIGQLKCLEANIVNRKEHKTLALNLIKDFKKDYKSSPKENMDQNKLE